MQCPTSDPRHEECPECGDCRFVKVTSYHKTPRIGLDGEQMIEPLTNTPMHVAVPMHSHVVGHSSFNASGLVIPNPLCNHGIPCPPDVDPGLPAMLMDRLTEEQRRGIRVIRSKYLNPDGKCPVCLGKPRPSDLAERRVPA